MNSPARFTFYVDSPNLNASTHRLGIQIVDYDALFFHILNKAAEGCPRRVIDAPASGQLMRVNWYSVGEMEVRNPTDPIVARQLRASFNRQEELREKYMELARGCSGKDNFLQLEEHAWRLCHNEIVMWFRQKQQTLAYLHNFYELLRAKVSCIDIRLSGYWKIDLLNRECHEKCVDNQLAVDMVTETSSYEVAILLTGDADFMPAVNFARRAGKYVVVVDLQSEEVVQGIHSSARLKAAADYVATISVADLKRERIATVLGPKLTINQHQSLGVIERIGA